MVRWESRALRLRHALRFCYLHCKLQLQATLSCWFQPSYLHYDLNLHRSSEPRAKLSSYESCWFTVWLLYLYCKQSSRGARGESPPSESKVLSSCHLSQEILKWFCCHLVVETEDDDEQPTQTVTDHVVHWKTFIVHSAQRLKHTVKTSVQTRRLWWPTVSLCSGFWVKHSANIISLDELTCSSQTWKHKYSGWVLAVVFALKPSDDDSVHGDRFCIGWIRTKRTSINQTIRWLKTVNRWNLKMQICVLVNEGIMVQLPCSQCWPWEVLIVGMHRFFGQIQEKYLTDRW